MTKTTYRGHEIKFEEDWVYVDNGFNISFDRPCGKCGNKATELGHDNCIANLPGVKHACCGHGNNEDAYIFFNDGRIIRGIPAIEEQLLIKNGGNHD